jgi:hypothetical protein
MKQLRLFYFDSLYHVCRSRDLRTKEACCTDMRKQNEPYSMKDVYIPERREDSLPLKGPLSPVSFSTSAISIGKLSLTQCHL